MSVILDRQRIRLKVDIGSRSAIVEARSGATPVVWRGNDVQMELSFWYYTSLLSVAKLASLLVEVYTGLGGALVLTKSLDAADLDDTLTTALWDADTGWHAAIPLTAAETNQAPTAPATYKDFYLVISALTSDVPARRLTLGWTTLRIQEDGTPASADAPPPPQGEPMSVTEAYAAFIARYEDGRNWRAAGSQLELLFPDGSWRGLVPEIVDGRPTLGFTAPV